MKNLINIFIKQRKKLANFNVVLSIITLIALMTTTNLLIQITTNNKQFEGINKNAHSLIDNFIGEKEVDFFSTPNAIQKIRTFYNNLVADETFEYGVLTQQPIYIPDLNINMKFLYGYGNRPNKYLEENVYSSIQINNVGLSKSKISLKEGRLFADDEYNYSKEKTLPLLLGYELREYFRLDDKINIEYLGEEIQYRVVGFLEKDSYIVNRNRHVVFLDRYFILPAINYINNGDMDMREYEFEKRLYLQHTNGIIYTDLSALTVQSKIEEYCRNLEMDSYILMGLPNINILGLETKEIIFILFAISTLLLFISIVNIMLNLLSITETMMRNYSIHYLCGARRSHIIVYLILEVILSIILAIVFVYILQFLIFGMKNTNWYLISSIIMLITIPPLPSVLKIYSMNIPQEIRR